MSDFVPTARIAPIIREILRTRFATQDEAMEIIEERSGVSAETVWSIVAERRETVDFDTADNILAALDATGYWHGELRDIYDGATLQTQKCAREGCSVSFIPNKRGRLQKYCSRRCGQMQHLKDKGAIKDAKKRNLKEFCRGGHRRTAENTDANGSCKLCAQESQSKRWAANHPGRATCLNCGEPMPPGKRSHAKFCKKSCNEAYRVKRLKGEVE